MGPRERARSPAERERQGGEVPMTIIIWLLEFVVCWIICVLVVTNIDPLVTRFSAWIDLKILKKDAPGTLAVTTVEASLEEERIRR
jgi:hypothetical protein